MITVIELSEMKEAIIRDPGCKIYVCINDPPKFLKFRNVQICPALAPYAKLVRDLKLELISHDEFRRKYSQYLKNNLLTRELAKYIFSESKLIDVYLVCNSRNEYQRLVLMEMFENISS